VKKTYTDKHLVLSDFMGCDEDCIENLDDMEFVVYEDDGYSNLTFKNRVWVMTDDDAFELLIECVKERLDEEDDTTCNIKDVSKVLGIEKDALENIFLPYVILGEMKLIYGWIENKPFVNLLKSNLLNSTYEDFIDDYSKDLLNNNKSGYFLCRSRRNTQSGGYNIYYR
jgi:hypothetical protein